MSVVLRSICGLPVPALPMLRICSIFYVSAFIKAAVKKDLDRYVEYVKRHGFHAEGFSAFGTDVVDEIDRLAPRILERFPEAVFFGGRLVFPKASFLPGIFHNYTIFAVQRRFYGRGIPVIVLPIRV